MPHESIKKDLRHLFKEALAQKSTQGIDDLFLSALIKTQRGVNVFEGSLDTVEIADEIKIGVLVGKDHRWAGATLEQARADSLKKAIEGALEASKYSDRDEQRQLQTPPIQPVSQKKSPDTTLLELKMIDLEKRALSIESLAKKFSSRVKNIPYAVCGYDWTTRLVMSSRHVQFEEENALLTASLSVMAAGEDGRMVNCFQGTYALNQQDFLKQDFVAQVAGEAVNRVNPQPVTSGEYPILFDHHTAAQLLHHFGNVFSGESLYRKLTRLEDKLGKHIASSHVSLIDSATAGLNPLLFDAEGSLAQTKFVIEDGVFQSFLHNLYTAKKVGAQTTGNASGGIGTWFGVTPLNFCWAGKTTPVSDIVANMSRGILIKELHGASASPVSGDFSYGAVGYWIENGQIQRPLSDFTVAGNFFDLLQKIEAIGDDLTWTSPHLLGSIGGRSVLVSALAVSGHQNPQGIGKE